MVRISWPTRPHRHSSKYSSKLNMHRRPEVSQAQLYADRSSNPFVLAEKRTRMQIQYNTRNELVESGNCLSRVVYKT